MNTVETSVAMAADIPAFRPGFPEKDQVEQPAQRTDDAGRDILLPRNAEQDREGGRTDKGGQGLDQEARRLRIRPDTVQLDQAAGHGAVQHEADTDADRDAEKAQQGIRQPGEPGEIIRVGEVPDPVHERNARNERHDGTDDDVGKAVPEADAIASDT